MDIYQQIIAATVSGDGKRCVALAQKVLAEKIDPFEAIQKGYSQGMEIVGEKFSRLEYFLPDLLRSSDAMKAALEVFKPYFDENKGRASLGSIVIGTIQGDVHDLGKNIVKTMLQAAGFTVYDLGCDVQVRRFVEKAVEVNADIIAASAILTTTMAFMPDLVALLKERNLRDRYKVMVGGAPVTAEFAAAAGADGYGEHAAAAVELAKRLVREKPKGGSH